MTTSQTGQEAVTALEAGIAEATGGIKRAATAIAADVRDELKVLVPEFERAGQLQRDALDGVTIQVIEQIDAAVKELTSMKDRLMSSADATKRIMDAHAALGSSMAHTTAVLRQAFQPPAVVAKVGATEGAQGGRPVGFNA